MVLSFLPKNGISLIFALVLFQLLFKLPFKCHSLLFLDKVTIHNDCEISYLIFGGFMYHSLIDILSSHHHPFFWVHCNYWLRNLFLNRIKRRILILS